MAKAKHILDQVIERNPLFARNARQRIDRNGNLIGDGSFHSLYDVFDIPNVRHEVRPSIGSESVYVKYVGDDNYENPAVVRYSRHDNNGTRFGSEIDGRLSRKRVLDEILYKLGFANPVYENRVVSRSNPIITSLNKKDIDFEHDFPTYEQVMNGRNEFDDGDIGKMWIGKRGVKRLDGFNKYDVNERVFKGYDIPYELQFLYDDLK